MVDRNFSEKNGVAVTPQSGIFSDLKWIKSETPSSDREPKKTVILYDDMTSLERLIVCLAEFAGTAVLVFIGCMGCIHNPPLEQVAFTFGLAIMLGVQCFGHISGAHINPAVTIAAATLGHFPLLNVPIYFAGQLLGAIAGFGLVKSLADTKPAGSSLGYCSPSPAPGLSAFQIFFGEFLLTLILIWACCAVWDNRNCKNTDSIALRLGLAVTGLALCGGTFTGANMNPARSFGPALLNGDWKLHWAYWLGPLSAAFLGALVYRVIFAKEPPSNETVPEMPTRVNSSKI